MSEASTALAVTPQNHDQPAALQVIPTATSAVILDRANLQFMADMIEAADLIPYDKNVTRPVQKARVMAKIVAGVAHDFDPVSAQENLHVIQGRCVLSARGMAIKLRRTGQYDTRLEKLDDEGCRVAVLEKNEQGKWILKGHVEWGLKEAKAAGLAGPEGSNKGMYAKWGPDMFYANTMKRVCRRFAAEVLDTKPVLYDTAKRPALPEQPPTPPAAQLVGQQGERQPEIPAAVPAPAPPAAEVGQEYVSQEYTGSDPSSLDEQHIIDIDTDDSFIASEDSGDEGSGYEDLDPSESRLVDLRIAAKECYAGLEPAAKRQADAWLGQRLIKDLNAEELSEFLSANQ